MITKLSHKKVVIVVAHEFEDIELLYPILRLSEEGTEIKVIPVQMGFHPRPYVEGKPVTGRFGHPVPIPVMPEGPHYRICELKDIKLEEVDCLLIPGGYSPDFLRRHALTLDLVRECHKRGKLIATIYHRPWILISAGIISGKRATGLVAVRDDLMNAGAEFVDEPVVQDGNIITSRFPNDLPEFCRAIMEALSIH